MSTSPAPRPHISISQVRRARARLNPSRPTRRVRADEAVISQWLREQVSDPESLHRPDPVVRVERGDLVGLGEGRVVEDRRHEEVEPAWA